MSNTAHLGLMRPQETDFYNVDVFNQNATRIDEAIQRIDEGFVPPENALTGISTQNAGATARTANVAGTFARDVGTTVWVKFQNSITPTNSTLNINGSGAADIRVQNRNGFSLADAITPNRYYCFMFTNDAATGASWQLLNPDGQTIPRAFSSTAATQAAKTAALDNFVRHVGSVVWVTFSTHNTAANPTLNVHNTGAGTIQFRNTRELITGRPYAFAFDGTAWQLLGSSLSGEKDGFGEVATTAGTTVKVASIPHFARRRGSVIWLRFVNGNTVANPTLNVNAAGALAIQFNGGNLPTGGIVANGVYGFLFDGERWQILNPTVSPVAAEILNMIYPVGSIYMSVNNVSPQTFIGGTWERWGNGRVPAGVNESDPHNEFTHLTNGRTGGSRTHTLTQAQMPSHSHTVNSHSHGAGTLSATGGSHGHHIQSAGWESDLAGTSFHAQRRVLRNTNGFHDQPTTNTTHTHTITGNTAAVSPATNAAGSGQAHNNLQPYITCFMWRRTA